MILKSEKMFKKKKERKKGKRILKGRRFENTLKLDGD
jgi:hypothetical protein